MPVAVGQLTTVVAVHHPRRVMYSVDDYGCCCCPVKTTTLAEWVSVNAGSLGTVGAVLVAGSVALLVVFRFGTRGR